jgi:hypothetical protein
MGKIYQIEADYLKELMDYSGKSLVGKILKRFEIIENRDIIKSDVKELVYEEIRQLRDLIVAHNRGLNITQFNFKIPTGDAKL